MRTDYRSWPGLKEVARRRQQNFWQAHKPPKLIAGTEQILRILRTVVLLIAGSAFISVAAHAAPATTGSQPDQTSGSTIVYEADFFREFNPVNVADMLLRIPGLTSALATTRSFGQEQRRERGLGAGEDQILINGKRVAGKENEGRDALTRIPAASVERIEIIRGTSGDLDVQSGGNIINIVLRADAETAAGSWRLSATRYQMGNVDPGGSISYGDTIGQLGYLFSVELKPSDFVFRTTIDSSMLDGTLIDFREERQDFDQDFLTLNGNFTYTFSDAADARLNLLYEDNDSASDRFRDIFVEDQFGELTLDRLILDSTGVTQHRWEVGGDFEKRFGNSGRFKILGIVNEAANNSLREVFDITADDEGVLTNLETRDRTEQERIVRTSLTWGIAKNQDMEIGVEGSQTILHSSLQILALVDDALSEVEIFNPDSRVEELRIEPFLVHNWKPAEKLSVETGLTLEWSEIDQVGSDVVETRSFFFARPTVDIRYDVSQSLQLKASIRRDISQLSFQDFVAAIDVNDVDNAVNAGNPDLAQEKAWKYEAAVEYRLPSDGGVVSLRLFYDDIEDIIDFVEVAPLVSARGNIGDGWAYGLEAQSSLRMGFLGLPGILVSGSFAYTKSQVTDPFLGTNKSIRSLPEKDWSASYRHDLPAWKASYGFDVSNRTVSPGFDIDETTDFKSGVMTNAFVEIRTFGNLTLRLDARNVLNTTNHFQRTRFLGNIVDDVIEEIEVQPFTRGAEWELSIRGNF